MPRTSNPGLDAIAGHDVVLSSGRKMVSTNAAELAGLDRPQNLVNRAS